MSDERCGTCVYPGNSESAGGNVWVMRCCNTKSNKFSGVVWPKHSCNFWKRQPVFPIGGYAPKQGRRSAEGGE